MTDTASPPPIDPTTPATPGYTTSEFWLTLLTAVAPALTIALNRDVTSELQVWAQIAAAVTTAVCTVAYIIKRTAIKVEGIRTQGVINAPAPIVNQTIVSNPTVLSDALVAESQGNLGASLLMAETAAAQVSKTRAAAKPKAKRKTKAKAVVSE